MTKVQCLENHSRAAFSVRKHGNQPRFLKVLPVNQRLMVCLLFIDWNEIHTEYPQALLAFPPSFLADVMRSIGPWCISQGSREEVIAIIGEKNQQTVNIWCCFGKTSCLLYQEAFSTRIDEMSLLFAVMMMMPKTNKWAHAMKWM